MSAFNARSAMKVIELLLWFLVWFDETFGVQIVEVIWSKIVRSSRTFRGRTGLVYSQLDRLQRWKARNRQTATCGGRIDRLQLRVLLIDRLQLLSTNTHSKLDRLQRLKACRRQTQFGQRTVNHSRGFPTRQIATSEGFAAS
jgi:hypothetical protein